MAAGLGADVTVMDINAKRLKYLNDTLPANVKTMIANKYNIQSKIKESDLIVGAVLVSGGKAPVLISESVITEMRRGTVLVDVAIDQGGCMETSRPTTHDSPTFTREGVVHYGVTNMPGAVPKTATLALTNATLPYVSLVANQGWRLACKKNAFLKKGLSIVRGNIVNKMVAETFGLPHSDVKN